MFITPEQYDALLQPLEAHRVASRKQGTMNLSYLETWDVRAHLIKIFGFCGWNSDVLSAELVFEDKDEKGRWNVGYKVVLRLSIHAGAEQLVLDPVSYTEAAVGSATLPQRGEAHDMAVTTAESDALKRAAVNLGTQFGLSLYDSGNRKDVVGATLVPPVFWEEGEPPNVPEHIIASVQAADDLKVLQGIWEQGVMEGWLDIDLPNGHTLRSIMLKRVAELKEVES
jgi:hypothetical protein